MQHFLQQNTIWKEVGDFHFQEDIQYALWVDKFGHFFGTNFVSYVMSEAYMLTGFSWNTATVLGGITGACLYWLCRNIGRLQQKFWLFAIGFLRRCSRSYVLCSTALYSISSEFHTQVQLYQPRSIWRKKSVKEQKLLLMIIAVKSFGFPLMFTTCCRKALRTTGPHGWSYALAMPALSLCNDNCDPNKIEKVNDATWGNRQYILSVDYSLAKLLPDWFPVWNWFKQSLMYVKMPCSGDCFRSRNKILFDISFQYPV